MNKQEIMLFGAGPMAAAYANVLNAQGRHYTAFCRTEESALRFQQLTGQNVQFKPFEAYYESDIIPELAIVAVSNDQLEMLTARLIKAGVRRILLEKPGAIDLTGIDRLHRLSIAHHTQILIGYNRRFYTSIQKAKEIAKCDGGILSCQFQFTEWLHTMPNIYPPRVLKHWLVSNPVHVIDTVFYLCGQPSELSTYQNGKIDWHPSGTTFTGAGRTDRNILFAYHSNWQSAGRWGIELHTRQRKLVLCPLEKLSEVTIGSVHQSDIAIEDALDKDFKPGLFLQVAAFLQGCDENFCDLAQQRERFNWYYQIAGYA